MVLPLSVSWDGESRSPESNATPIVLLHGFAGDGETWDQVRAGLRRHGPTLAVDLLGHGKSPAPEDPVRYSMLACLEDLRATVEGLGINRAWWIGYSMGARIALQLAVHKPQLVRGLVLESGTPGLSTVTEREARAKSDEALAQQILDQGMEAFVEQWLAQPMFEALNALPEEQLALEREIRLRQRPNGLAHSLRGLGTGAMAPVWERLDEVDAPVLLLTGEEDTKFTRIASRMALAISGAQLVRIPLSGHLPHTEQPEAFLRTVNRFLLAHQRVGHLEIA